MSMPVIRTSKSINYSLPAPTGGLNVRDSLDVMARTDAIVMDNYIPRETKVSLRKGYTMHAKLTAPVMTLAAYKKAGSERLIGVSGGKAYNLTSKKNVRVLSGASFQKNRCQTVRYKDRLFLMNGVDTPKVFYVNDNGEDVLEDWGFEGEGLTAAKIISGGVSKQFLWFVEKETLKVWYAASAGNISGTLKAFDLSQTARFGGSLAAVCCWTVDGGTGIDDLTVFITTEGEVLVYAGINPNSADEWSLKGSFKIARPIGAQCTMPYQGDIVVITEEGYLPLSKVLPLAQAGTSAVSFSDKINGLVLERAASGKNKDGWQSVMYPKGGFCLFNVPVSRLFEQHVITLNTGAWCRFTGIKSYCWELFEGRLYFGADYGVCLFDDGCSDNGTPIAGEVRQAFCNLGTDNLKKIQLLNPRTKSATKYALVIYTDMDFEERRLAYAENLGSTGLTRWNEAPWSSLANPVGTKWQTLRGVIRSQWIANSATGFKASVVFKTKTRGNMIDWYDTGVRYETAAGVL
ncbi:MAG: hypothetical protein PUH03_03100 [bacterium]|mgnify:FL=1|nr:hypothetical protein [bacterium]MDY2830919.1 hypothetical protein [Alphaproteobacteria bacterium]